MQYFLVLQTFSDKFLTKINVWAHNWRQLYSLFAFCDSFEPAVCFSGIGIELECFLIVANGSIGHVLLLALFSQECVFGSQSFQCFVAFGFLLSEHRYFSFLAVNQFQLVPNKSFGEWLLNVVTTVDG